MKRRPRLYFSLRSPYSWLTMRRLREIEPDLSAAVECFPYWDPDAGTTQALEARGGEFHYLQMSRAKHLYMLMDTKRVAARAGVKMAWPVDIDPWWELPHLAWLYARHEGREWAMYDALTEARWGRGENICDADVVAAAAKQAGLDPAAAVAAAGDPEIRAEAVECLYQAYLDDIFGIPYLKWGSNRFWGLDRVDEFLDVWRPDRATEPPPAAAEPVLVPQSYDRDTAGGCG